MPKTYKGSSTNVQDNSTPNQLRSNLFPQLPVRITDTVQDAAIITVQDRMSLMPTRRTTMSYSNALSKKKRRNPVSPTYDRLIHEAQLFDVSLPLSPIIGNNESSQVSSHPKPNQEKAPSLSDKELINIISKRLTENDSSEMIKSLADLIHSKYVQSPIPGINTDPIGSESMNCE